MRLNIKPVFLLLLLSFSAVSVFAQGTPLDFDGDGKADMSLFDRNSGFSWTVRSSLTGTIYKQNFGISEDLPVPGDYNGDNKTEYAVFRPSTGIWYNSTTAFPNVPAGFDAVKWGLAGDFPVPGDYNGDGITDRAVFRPSNGVWYILNSDSSYTFFQFGISTDIPVQADYDSDGKTDIAITRSVSGYKYWYIYRSSDSTYQVLQFGLDTDRAAVLRIGSTHLISAFRPGNTTWYFRQPNGGFSSIILDQFQTDVGFSDNDNDGQDDINSFRFNSGAFYYVRPWNTGRPPYYTNFGTATGEILSGINVK